MKRITTVVLICLLFILSSCEKSPAEALKSQQNATETATFQPDSSADLPTAKPPEPTRVPVPTESKNKPYDPSIFIIEASGSWRDELAPEYFADYEVEIYLNKIDANDNRAVAGSYQGVFWMKTTLDTAGFIKNMLGDVPVDATYEAGGEAVSDNLAISLNNSDDKAWTDYSILGEDGIPLPLTQDNPVAKGSFVVVAKNLYLEAHASGAQGEKVDYSSSDGNGDVIDLNYVIHVEPDSAESNGERKVIIHLSGENFSKTIEGIMRRIPGYMEDVSDYLNSAEYQNSTWSRLNP